MAGLRGKAPSRRVLLLVTLFLAALVLLPFLFWYDTWFGRELSEAKIEEYLNDTKRPRRAQQAMVQIAERMSRGEESARRWYPKIMKLAAHSSPELRQTAAWVMGQDRGHEPFRPVLLGMMGDAAPLVRRNAALALAAFRDAAGREELRGMLRPFTLESPAAGRLEWRLKTGDYLNPGTLIARVEEHEVRSPLPGDLRSLRVKAGAEVRAGDPIAEISPDQQHAWEALRALFLVGNRDDLELVRRYARGVEGMDTKVQQQALVTLRQIESR